MTSRRMIAGLVFLIVSAGTALGQKDSMEKSLLAADAAWNKVYSVKDLDKAMAFCDDQVSMLVSNVPIATGKEAVRKAIADDFASGDLVWHANKAGVARSGDMGYTVGSYDLKMKDASGKPILDKGKFITIWKKHADGSWKVIYDMFNTDLPLRSGSQSYRSMVGGSKPCDIVSAPRLLVDGLLLP